VSRRQLAEEAFDIARNDLHLPDGVQDFYLASFGNFVILDIDHSGAVHVSHAQIKRETQEQFEQNVLLFYTGVRRSSTELLQEQKMKLEFDEWDAVQRKHEIKRIGKDILACFESGDLDKFGRLMDEHWRVKKGMSQKMSTDLFDEIYEQIKREGALGGKIVGAGGGGFFLVYAPREAQPGIRRIFQERGMREIAWRVDAGGTHVLVQRPRTVNTI
ncbi:MAG TPA: galactokinase, partial [Patescibacteria group bacterium]|nr:galactokinase [Patescibacteria group bacterium]